MIRLHIYQFSVSLSRNPIIQRRQNFTRRFFQIVVDLFSDERFQLYQKLGTCLRVINNVEICIELIAHKWDPKKKWFFVLAIEFLKFVKKSFFITLLVESS